MKISKQELSPKLKEELISKADKTVATTTHDGLFAKEDKIKLDGLSSNKTDNLLNSTATNIDENGIYTVVTYKRQDGTLYMTSTLSNVNTDGNYLTCTIQEYNDVGTSITKTSVWTLTYDDKNKITTKVVK